MYVMSSCMAQSLPAAMRSWGVQPAELLVPCGRAQSPAREAIEGVGGAGLCSMAGLCLVAWQAALWLHPPSSGFACLMGACRVKVLSR